MAGLAFAATACQTDEAPAGDGGPPPVVECRTDKDCPAASNCSFPIDIGCTAIGECRSFPADADVTMCSSPGGPACACNGQTIDVPPCWNFLAQLAVLHMGACDAGAGD